jgi:hypothetical protein
MIVQDMRIAEVGGVRSTFKRDSALVVPFLATRREVNNIVFQSSNHSRCSFQTRPNAPTYYLREL